MKIAVCLLLMLGSESLLSAQEEKPSTKTIILDAQIALRKLDMIQTELSQIFRKKADGYTGAAGLTEPEKKRELELYRERSACLERTVKVAEILKTGTSVFSYPGLIALSKIDFDARKNTYAMRLVVDFRRYEDGEERHPTYRVVEFNQDGLITGLKEFATVRKVLN